jgi:hypothetical protein
LKKQIYEPNLDDFDNLDDDCLGDPNHLGCIQVTLCQVDQQGSDLEILRMNAVRWAFTQPKETDDWRKKGA